MSLVEVAIAHQNPIAVFETAPVAVDIVDQNTILVENTPVVGVVQYIAVKGDPGEDGHTPDWANPGDVADLIEALSGQITATQLHSDLLAPIQKIDVGPTSLEARAAMLEYADSLLNTSIAENADRIAASEAAITTIDGQITELGVDTQTLDGRITGNAAAIDSLETRVTINESDIYTQAQQITGLSTRVNIAEADQSAQAIIINQNTTAITALDGDITSIASSISTIQADVADNTASIQTNATAIATLDGEVSTEYTLKTDVNGKIAGFGLFNDGTISIFEILADRFAITNGLNSGIVPFIVDGANVYIQNGFIQNAAIDTARIADASITTAKIRDAEITNAKIADATITTAKIGDAQITAAKIADAQITSAKIANATITTADIADAQITNALIADAAINSAKIQDAQITAAKIADANITTAKIQDANITTAKIADAQITAAKIVDANITTAKIGDAQITTLKIGANQVTIPVGGTANGSGASCTMVTDMSTSVIIIGTYSGASQITNLTLRRNGTPIRTIIGLQSATVSFFDSVSAGSYTYSVTTDQTVTSTVVSVIGAKR